MKKNAIILVVLVLLLGFSLEAREREEMIVLFDTSVSVLPIYDDLVSLVVQGIAENQLEGGDTFHLLSFDDAPVYELTQNIHTSEDLVTIGRYMEVLKPMGVHTDLIQALNFLYNFTRDLSINSKKTILILTDGIHDPAPGSVHYGRSDEYVRRTLETISDRINRQGWKVRILDINQNGLSALDSAAVADGLVPGAETDRPAAGDASSSAASGETAPISQDSGAGGAAVPPEGSDPQSSGENLLSQLSQELKAPVTSFSGDNKELAIQVMGIAGLSFEENLGQVRSSFTVPLELTNYGDLPIRPTLLAILWDNSNLLKESRTVEIKPGETEVIKAGIRLPADKVPGEFDIPVTFQFSDGVKVSPLSGHLNFTLTESGGTGFDATGLYAVLVLLGLAVIVASAVLIRRHLERTADDEKYQRQASRLTEEIAIAEAMEGAQPGHSTMSEGSVAPAVLAATSETTTIRRSGGKEEPSSTEAALTVAGSPKVSLQQVKTVHTVHQSKPSPKARGMVSIPPKDRQYAVEMKVEEQNPFVGTRNIRAVKDTPVSLGGKGSPFHIFIRPFPERIAEISRRDGRLVLTPLKPEFFADLKGPLVNCLNQRIRLKDKEGREVKIVFQHWVSPLERINRLMHSIDTPGIYKEEV